MHALLGVSFSSGVWFYLFVPIVDPDANPGSDFGLNIYPPGLSSNTASKIIQPI